MKNKPLKFIGIFILIFIGITILWGIHSSLWSEVSICNYYNNSHKLFLVYNGIVYGHF